MVKYNVLTCYPLPSTGKWLSVSLFLSCISLSPLWIEGKVLCIWITPLEKCLLWSARPMLDLRGLISLDNKTKRVNVLIVADGAGILGKCVKLVLTSGSHSSPPRCDLLLTSFCFTPQSFHPSLLPHPLLHSSCDPVPCFSLLHPYTQQFRGMELHVCRRKGELPGWCELFIHIWISMKTSSGLQSNKIRTSLFIYLIFGKGDLGMCKEPR